MCVLACVLIRISAHVHEFWYELCLQQAFPRHVHLLLMPSKLVLGNRAYSTRLIMQAWLGRQQLLHSRIHSTS